MGSLRSLNRGKIPIRYELFLSWTGHWQCLDWSSVKECDILRAKRDAANRIKDHRQRFSSIFDILDKYSKVTIFKWNTATWIMSSHVRLEQKRSK
jgi:hypothetical protein